MLINALNLGSLQRCSGSQAEENKASLTCFGPACCRHKHRCRFLKLQMLGPKLLYQQRLSSRDVYSSSRACSLPDGIGFPQPHNHLCPFLASNTHVTTNRACLIGGFLHVQVKQILYLLKCFPYKTQTS